MKQECAIALRRVGLTLEGSRVFEGLGIHAGPPGDPPSGRRPPGDARDPGTVDRYPPELAPALHRRVALAQAVAARPPILLCDGPIEGLDPWQAEALRAALRRLHCTLGLTTLVATQDLLSAYDLGDRVAVLQGGKVVFNRRGNAPACRVAVAMPAEGQPITPAAA